MNHATTRVKRRNLLDEIADRSNDPRFFKSLGWLPNPDEVLRKRGDRPEILRSVLTDSHIWGNTQIRKSAVLGSEFQVLTASDSNADRRAAELCEAVVNRLNMEDVIETILDAPLYGHRLLEIIWERGSVWVPKKIVDRPNRRLVFGDENEPRILTRRAPMLGEEAPGGKLLIARHKSTYENPYGEATLSRCLWPWVFKVGGIKYWLRFAEKYGSTFAIGKLPRGAAREEYDRLCDDLNGMIQNAVAAIPDDASVELMEAAGKTASANLYLELIKFMNGECSKAILGQTLTTEASDKGTHALGSVHDKVRGDLVSSDMRIVSRTMGEVFELVTALNVPNATAPRFAFYEEDEVPAEWAEVINKVRSFIPIPERWAREKLGNIPEPDGEESILPQTTETSSAPSVDRLVTGRPSAVPSPRSGGRPGLRADVEVEEFSEASVDWLDELYRATVAEYRREVAPLLRSEVSNAVEAIDSTTGVATVARMLAPIVPETVSAEDAVGRFEDLVGRACFTAALAAFADVEAELADDEEFVAGVIPEPLRFLAAEQAFAERIPLTSAQVAELARDARTRAFWISGVAQLDAVVDVQVEIENAIRSGSASAPHAARIDEILTRKGWAGLGPYRAGTVLRNAIQGAHMSARYRAMTTPRVLERRPYWEYVTAGDDMVRPHHSSLDGLVMRADDYAWSSIFPSNGHRCRCTVRTLSDREVSGRGLSVESGAQLFQTPRPVPGSTATVIPSPDKGFDQHPSRARIPDLSNYPKAAVDRYVARAGERWAADFASSGLSREDWLFRIGAEGGVR